MCPKKHKERETAYYKDRGCKYFASCLECPLEICLEELGRKEREAFIKKHGLKKKDG